MAVPRISSDVIELDGSDLDPRLVGSLPDSPLTVTVGARARGRVLRAWAAVEEIAATRPGSSRVLWRVRSHAAAGWLPLC